MEIVFLIILLVGVLSASLIWFSAWLTGFFGALYIWRNTNSSFTFRFSAWIITILFSTMSTQYQFRLILVIVILFLALVNLPYREFDRAITFVIVITVTTLGPCAIKQILRVPDDLWYLEYLSDLTSHFGIFFGTLCGLLYVPYYYDGAEYDGRRNWKWFRSLRVWRLIHAYFGLDFEFKNKEKVMRLMAKGPVMYSMHPHGLWTVSGPFGAGTHAGKIDFDILMGITRIIFWIPFYRDLALWAGSVDASKSTIENLLKLGKTVGLAPGGVQEMILANVDELDLYLEHEGFLRLCWDLKVPAIPTFCRGENRIFLTLDVWPAFRKRCAHMIGYPLPAVFLGPWMTDLRIFIGDPISPQTDDDDDEQEFDDFKREYYTELFILIRDNETHAISPHLKEEMDRILGKCL